MIDVFFNGKLIGNVNNPKSFVEEVIEGRRKGEISNLINRLQIEDIIL